MEEGRFRGMRPRARSVSPYPNPLPVRWGEGTRRGLALVVVMCALIGCKSHSPSQYVSPRVTGRVLDAETRQPLAEARLQRVNPERALSPYSTMKGGQMMQQAPLVILSGVDGTFVVDSERTLVLFRK